MRFSIYQESQQGARASNQDRMGYVFSRESLLMMVCDGMGGHLRGEVAAQLSLQAAGALFQQQARPRLRDPARFLDEALRAGHRELHRYREANNLRECPRTTVVGCVIQGGQVWWAHAGDSRVYMVRKGQLLTRTRDHSKVENMLTMGLITEAECETHPERNKVLNCLGSPFDPTVEISQPMVLQDGDCMMLCSDGFWSGLKEPQIGPMLTDAPLYQTVPQMVRQAVIHNGATADNTTCLALRWVGEIETGSQPTISTLDLPDGAVTTTIGLVPDAVPAENKAAADVRGEFSEDEIERTIAEIHNALQRSGRNQP